MWRALNARPEDLMREVQRLEALEKDLRSLRVSIQRNEQALADVRASCRRPNRSATPIRWSTAWRCWRWPPPCWRPGPGAAAALPLPRGLRRGGGRPPRIRATARRRCRAPARAASRACRQPAPLRDTGEPAAAVVDRRAPKEEPPPSMPRPSQDFSPSMRGDDFRASNSSSLRALRAEELHDVQQEADFFISLGEFDRAIEVLRSHISMNPETSAVAWLDLMEIYHKLDRRHDYEWVRRQFQHNYNADVPEFDNYTDASAGLEDYQNAMTRIVALWPSRRVLDVIEESIFRGPSSDGSNAFTLQAYRDLLLLHHIGTEIVGTEEEGRTSSFFGDLGQPPNFDPSSFSATAISPLSALTGNDARHGPDSEIGLDINLDEPSPGEEMLIGAAQRDDDSTHLLDFDLPDMDLSTLKPKKTRE
jgi:hypothetical protein